MGAGLNDTKDTKVAQDWLDRYEAESAQAVKESESEVKRLANDWRNVIADKSGARIIRRILDKSGFFAQKFTGNAAMYYMQGRADIGREIMEEITMFYPRGFMEICVSEFKKSYEARKGKAKQSGGKEKSNGR